MTRSMFCCSHMVLGGVSACAALLCIPHPALSQPPPVIVNIVETSWFDGPTQVVSTDPSGLTTPPDEGSLWLSDSEISGTSFAATGNLFKLMPPGDTLLEHFDLIGPDPINPLVTSEMTGVAYNSVTDKLYSTNDTKLAVFVLDPSDPLQNSTSFSTLFGLGVNANDPEGLSFNPTTGNLYIGNGSAGDITGIFEVTPGGALVSTLNLAAVISNVEGLYYDPRRDHFFILDGDTTLVEVDATGSLVRTIDFCPSLIRPQNCLLDPQVAEYSLRGITFAPTSDPHDDEANLHAYLADWGIDSAPDGRIYEVALDGAAPVLDPIEAQTITEGDLLSLPVSATDPDSHPITLKITSTTLPNTPPVLTDFGNGTGQFEWQSGPGEAESYTVTITAADNFFLSDSETFSVTVQEPDTDDDGVSDNADNCIEVPNGPNTYPPDSALIQRDTDGDGFGNVCDADFDGNCAVDAADRRIFEQQLDTNDPDADLDGNATVDAMDQSLFEQLFGKVPGPSGIATCP